MKYVEGEHIMIADVEARFKKADQVIDSYIFDVGLGEKDSLRLRLLAEEVLRLAKSIIGQGIIEFWIEGNARVSRIYLTSKNHLEKSQQDELISVSSTGENKSEQGFLGIIKSMFMMEGIEEERWSLRDYQEEILRKREEDKYSQEAWDDLERSLVANLSDDIEVSIDKKMVKMVVTKDFSEALSTIGSKKPIATSRHTFIDSSKNIDDSVFEKVEEMLYDLGVEGKDALHLKLLFEETMGMLKELAADYHAAVWFERYKHECCIKLTGKTIMDMSKKENLLNVASRKGNSLVSGFMDKVGDVIENGLLSYNDVMNLQQEYGGGSVNYGTMGMYNGVEGMGDSGVMWSLYEYRGALKGAKDEQVEAKEAWDELEKSIVASLAKDVIVGVKGDRIDMTIVCDIK